MSSSGLFKANLPACALSLFTDFSAQVLFLVPYLPPSKKMMFSLIQVFVAFVQFINPSKHISFDS